MLGRHSEIEGTGELKIMRNLAEIVRHRADDPEHYAALLEIVPDEQLAWLGERYIEASHDYRKTAKPRFIDKNNLNWTQVGLVLLALLNAWFDYRSADERAEGDERPARSGRSGDSGPSARGASGGGRWRRHLR